MTNHRVVEVIMVSVVLENNRCGKEMKKYEETLGLRFQGKTVNLPEQWRTILSCVTQIL